MKRLVLILLAIALFVIVIPTFGQKRGIYRKVKPAAKAATNNAIIIDDRLAVLRTSPSLYSKPIRRMGGGRQVKLGESKEAEGVVFYRVFDTSKAVGWIQADAVAGVFRRGDDERLARLVQGSEGFDRIERAAIFLEMFPDSVYRPPILLFFGDLIEEEAQKLSVRATRGLKRSEMAASGAPLHSFYLNYPFLDRYRKLGIVFLFNSNTLNYHYDGATWKELLKKFPDSPESIEAKKRIDSLDEKLGGRKR